MMMMMMTMTLRSASADMIDRAVRLLSSGTVTRRPLPPRDADDGRVRQQTDGEYHADDAVPVSTEPAPATAPRFLRTVVCDRRRATADQLLRSPLRLDADDQVQRLLRLLLLLLVITVMMIMMMMMWRRRNGMTAHHLDDPKQTSAVVDGLEQLRQFL